MNDPIENRQNALVEFFQATFGHEDLLFQIDLFPLPIELFAPDGTSLYINRAFWECFNIPNSSQIVGHLNLLQDAVLNDEMGLSEYLRWIFEGETLSVSDIKVPFDEMVLRYDVKKTGFDIDAMYQDITSFPIWDQRKKIAYIVTYLLPRECIWRGRTSQEHEST